MFTGKTAVGTLTKSPAIAIANTARTNQVNIITKMRNIIRTLLLITDPVILAIVFPFSLTEITRAPKSWTAPIKIVPKTIHKKAGNQPQ